MNVVWCDDWSNVQCARVTDSSWTWAVHKDEADDGLIDLGAYDDESVSRIVHVMDLGRTLACIDQ